MAIGPLLDFVGSPIQDPEEETFLLFTHPPTQNLGFIDPKAPILSLTIAGKDLTVHQSPSLLSSNRPEGTTGTVVWKITPLFAEWISKENNFLFRSGILDKESTVLELGCGVSGIVPLALSDKIGRYVATDLEYVFRTLRQNLAGNTIKPSNPKSSKHRGRKTGVKVVGLPGGSSNVEVLALDWESSSISSLPSFLEEDNIKGSRTVDVVLACDCIYNEALIEPFVRTCVDICRLNDSASTEMPTVCVVAQQLRSDIVFEAWLVAFHETFEVWRVPDELLTDGLKEGTGFVVHIGILRGTGNSQPP